MPSTFSTSLKLELPQNGEQSGIWGQTLNNDLNLIEQAVTNISDIFLTGDYTLTSFNGLPDEARNAVISCTGSLSSPANVIAPSVQKTYIISNNTGANVTIKTSTGNGVVVLNATNTLVYCDGTDFYQAVSLNNVTGNQTISGNEVIGANLTAGGKIIVTSNVSSYNGNLTLYSNTSVITAATNTGGYVPPTGTAAQRPASPVGGMSRFNTDAGVYEIFNGTIWQPITGAYSVNYLIVAGGGAGRSGGGGAGGLLANVASVQPGTAYTITVGAGGSGANGTNSTALGFTAIGGGKGNLGADGSSGGSGGGGANGEPAKSGGSGTSGQGYAGGNGFGVNISGVGDGGGGGASAAGENGQNTRGGNGGSGATSTITGSSVTYAGGGGGGSDNIGGSGGSGGGGRGSGNASGDATPGTANTGGGGGGGAGREGGSGVIILSYPSASQRGTGGTVTTYTSGGITYWVHTFTTSGTYTA